MREVERHGVRTIAELVEALELDKSTISRLVKSLLGQGFLSAVSNPGDQRRKPLQITETGKERLRYREECIHQRIETALSLVDPHKQGVIVEGLRLYSQALRRSRIQQQYEIREMEKEDFVSVTTIVQRVMREYGFDGSEFENYSQDLGFAETDESTIRLLAVRGERVVGCAALQPKDDETNRRMCELRKMFLLPEARGVGIGTRLLNECFERARSLEFTHCYVETTSRMVLGKNLYEKMGFEQLAARIGEPNYTACDEWYLKEL